MSWFESIGAFSILACWIVDGASSPQVPGLKVPPGFEVAKVADDALATNIYCMAISPRGETFVSGPGYIKRLLDADGDGVFDSATIFANGPSSGAQGINFDGNDLLCTGDGGLLRFVDADGNRVADGPPMLIMPIKTGGEHLAHAIRRGPDGWWYVLAGNQTPVLKEYYSGPNSPVVQPRAGFLMRISPDWNTKEIFAHGFRNAYDFDFNSIGEVFVYDSDGERDISLPWYRPTRLFRMRAGDDAGWVSAGWKRPSSFFDMPIEIGRLGRGSPTGVVVSSSEQFPAKYDDAIFVADWTFGRVTVFRSALAGKEQGRGRYEKGEEFAIADGQFGFAVTDLDFATDGSLLISVGGRGTKGGVYRITFRGDDRTETERRPDWIDEWVLRSKSVRLSGDDLVVGLDSPEQRIRLAALEALIGRRDIWAGQDGLNQVPLNLLQRRLLKILENGKPKTIELVLRVLSDAEFPSIPAATESALRPEAAAVLSLASLRRNEYQDAEQVVKALLIGPKRIDVSDPRWKLQLRVAQLSLGGCDARESDQMFAGYSARFPIALSEQDSNVIADRLAMLISEARNSANISGDWEFGIEELGRLAAMLNGRSDLLQQVLTEQLDRKEATATRDIHWLNCISQTSRSGQFSELETSRIANALVGLGQKIERDGQNLDRNFYPRMRSLVEKLLKLDHGILAVKIAQKMSGRADQVYLIDVLPPSVRGIAREQLASWVNQNRDEVTLEQIQELGSDASNQYLPLIRSFATRSDLKTAVVTSLARKHDLADREIFIAGLSAMDVRAVKASAVALRRMNGELNSNEVLQGLHAAYRLGWDKQSVSVRDQLVMLLRLRSGVGFGYQTKQPEVNQSEAMARWMDWAKRIYPEKFEVVFKKVELVDLGRRLETIDWSTGNSRRGERLYRTLQCARCHDAGLRLGPRLEGVTRRFDRDDLFRAIVAPSDQVAERYRAVLIETTDGQFLNGSVVYESIDGITLQEANGNTVRINQDEIEARTVSRKSLMPDGLLDQASGQDWADLYTYLNAR